MLEAVERDADTFMFALKRLRNHRALVTKAALRSPLTLTYAHSSFRDDKEVILNALGCDAPSAFRLASKR